MSLGKLFVEVVVATIAQVQLTTREESPFPQIEASTCQSLHLVISGFRFMCGMNLGDNKPSPREKTRIVILETELRSSLLFLSSIPLRFKV
jgi:hypothetical protein